MSVLDYSSPLIMGILNVTPDSFSDGGDFDSLDRAVAHGVELVSQGADIIDVGGESTRPGARRVSAEEQKRRVIEVIRRLRAEIPIGTAISIDTTLSEVAAAALDAGANIINDISAGRDDSDMLSLAARTAVPIVLMHMQGNPQTMQDNPHYEDVVLEVREFLLERAALARAAGVVKEQIILDPGIGFGKRHADNLQLLLNLNVVVATGYPVLLGTSRKRFMGRICAAEDPRDLVSATCATTAIGVMAGVAVFRVHDVRQNRQAADVAWAIRGSEYSL